MADSQTSQPASRFEDGLVDDPEGRAGDACLFCRLPLAGVVQRAACDLGEVQMRTQYPQRGPPTFPAPGRRLNPVTQRGKNFVRVLARLHESRAADRGRGAGPYPADVVQGVCLPRAQHDVPSVPSALVFGMQQQPRQLVDGAAGASDMAGDGRRDPVLVLGRVLTVRTQDQGPAVGGELAVTARRVAAGEVSEQNEIGCSLRQLVKAQSLAWVKRPSGRTCLVGAVWHCGAVPQGQRRHPGPLKPRVVSGTDLQSVPAKPPGWPSWRHSYAWLRCWRQASPSRLDRDRFRVLSAGSQPDPRRPTWADSEPDQRAIASDWLRAARFESGPNQSGFL